MPLLQLSAQGDAVDSGLDDACGTDPSQLCEWVYDRTDNATVTTLVDWAVNRPLRILLVLVLAFVLSRLVKRAIEHFTDRLAEERSGQVMQELRSGAAGRLLLDQDTALEARNEARVETVSSVLSSTTTLVIWTVAGLLVLGEVGISLAPLLAGAGIAGLAIGFGAQTIVRDFLSGFFMLVEDQYGVGDVIDVGDVTGTVERVTLRTTRLRDVNGVLWHVPNGEVKRVGNLSQLWSRAVLDIEVAYDTDLRLAQGVLQRVADEVWRDPEFLGGDIIEPPEVWGVENLGSSGIALRLVVKTDPAEQWVVARELRLRIKEAFDEAGIEIPFPQQTVRLAEPSGGAAPDPSQVRVHPIRRSQEPVAEEL